MLVVRYAWLVLSEIGQLVSCGQHSSYETPLEVLHGLHAGSYQLSGEAWWYDRILASARCNAGQSMDTLDC